MQPGLSDILNSQFHFSLVGSAELPHVHIGLLEMPEMPTRQSTAKP